MSFSQDVKTELCTLPMESSCCTRAESYGILLFANVFRADEIRIITQNRAFAERVCALFQRTFGVLLTPEKSGENSRFVLKINDETAIFRIFETLGLDPDTVFVRLDPTLITRDCCRGAFLRGAFLSGGSVADPDTRYHLEFSTPYRSFSSALQNFFMDLGLTPHQTMRAGKHLIYFKLSEAIEEILTHAGAHRAALQVMEAKVVKEVRNNVNRYVNCETANITKTVAAAQPQTQAIRALAESGRLDTLPEALRETARVRLENPEASLASLGAMISPPVNRATLNYRLKKLMDIALQMKKEENA